MRNNGDTFPIFVGSQVRPKRNITQEDVCKIVHTHGLSISTEPIMVSFDFDLCRGSNPPASRNPVMNPPRVFEGSRKQGTFVWLGRLASDFSPWNKHQVE